MTMHRIRFSKNVRYQNGNLSLKVFGQPVVLVICTQHDMFPPKYDVFNLWKDDIIDQKPMEKT
jgi:hypothetical protein